MNYNKFKVVNLIPNEQSSGEAWKNWHIAMKSRFGKKQANLIWQKGWDSRAGKGSDASTTDLRQYMQDEGVNIDTTPYEALQDKINDVEEGILDFFRLGVKFNILLGITAIAGIAITFKLMNKKENKDKAVMVFESTPYGQGYKAVKNGR